jgi:hypothetical protein
VSAFPAGDMRGSTGRRTAWCRLAVVALALALAGCTAGQLPCPAAKILRDGDRVTKFMPGQPPGPQSVQYVGEIAAAKLSCSYDTHTYQRLDVALGIQITAQRNPAHPTPDADLRYFVAIVNLQGDLLAKQEFPLRVPFPPGSNDVTKVESILQTIPLTYPQNGGSLQVWVGFQLSDQELEYNRSHPGS